MGPQIVYVWSKTMRNNTNTPPQSYLHATICVLSSFLQVGGPPLRYITLGIPPLPLGRLLDLQNLIWGRPGAPLGRPWETLPEKVPKKIKKNPPNHQICDTVFNFLGWDFFASRSAPGLGGELPHIRGEPP